MTDLQVEYLPLAALLPYARNSRTHSDAQVAQIAASVKEFGWTNPILVSPEGDIIAGHGRALAAARLKMGRVPCIRLGHLTETQRRAYVIADNRLAENGGWDLSMLAVELEDLQGLSFDMDLLGFNGEELDKYLNGSLDQPPIKEGTGAVELGEGQFQEFDHKCPKCGFEFDAK